MALSVFMDTSIQRHAIDQRWIKEKQSITWGSITQAIEIEQVKPREPLGPDHKWLQSELDRLPEVGEAARRGKIVCFENQEVRFELMNLDYGGLVKSKMSALFHVTVKKVPPPLPERTVIIGSGASWEDQKKSWATWLRSCADPRYAELRSALGTLADNTLVDLYHLYSAEQAGLDVYLTLDKNSFVQPLRRQSRVKPRVKVLYPSELLFRLAP